MEIKYLKSAARHFVRDFLKVLWSSLCQMTTELPAVKVGIFFWPPTSTVGSSADLYPKEPAPQHHISQLKTGAQLLVSSGIESES